MERFHVAEKANDEFVVAKVLDTSPQERPSHVETKEEDENLLGVRVGIFLRLCVPS
jgi:hypothetical protein